MISPLILTGEIRFAGGYVSADYFISEEYTTNVQGRSDSGEDFITSVNPGISYRTEIANLEIGTRVGYDFVRYKNLKQLDSENLDIRLFTTIQENPETAFSIDDISISAAENTRRSPEIGRVIRSRDYDASILASYRFTGLYSISSGIVYSKTEPLSENLNETESYKIPLNISYRHSGMLSYGIGYRFRNEDSSGAQFGDISITDHTLYGFASGTISPLINGSLQLGAQLQKTGAVEETIVKQELVPEDGSVVLEETYIPGSNEDDDINIAPYIFGNLAWLISNATSFNFGVSTNFGTTIAGQTNQGYGANVGLSHAFSKTMSGNLSLSLNLTEFSGNETTERKRTYEDFLIVVSEQGDILGYIPTGPVIKDTVVDRNSDNRDDRRNSGTRDETQWIIATGLSKQIGENSSLDMNLQYTDNKSSDDLFTYDEFSISFRFSQKF